MMPSLHAMLGRKQYGDATFVGAFSGTGAAITWPSGRQTGDMAVLAKRNSSAPSGWTSLGLQGNGVYLFTRLLDASDLASPPAPGVHYCGCVYREPRLLTQKAVYSSQGLPGSAVNVMGFTKSVLCAGRICLVSYGAAYSGAVAAPFTNRIGVSDGSDYWSIYDHLSSAAFTSGAGVDVSWVTADPAGPDWAMLELTN